MSEQQRDVVWPAEAAALSGVPVSTLRRWAVAGWIWSMATLGRHHRYDRSEMIKVRELTSELTVDDIAAMFYVQPHTVPKWVKGGRLTAVRTPSGKLRFLREDVDALLKGGDTDES